MQPRLTVGDDGSAAAVRATADRTNVARTGELELPRDVVRCPDMSSSAVTVCRTFTCRHCGGRVSLTPMLLRSSPAKGLHTGSRLRNVTAVHRPTSPAPGAGLHAGTGLMCTANSNSGQQGGGQ
ncbi:hypothetical protein GCM10009676_17180 [Prauserella halophila]|uniref:Uncharacterized protein n=1 Tax=Prauserella halophila TaxID=185641 RepID=A0ABP4GS56_9PSEU